MSNYKNSIKFIYKNKQHFFKYIYAVNKKDIKAHGVFEYILPNNDLIISRKGAVEYVINYLKGEFDFKRKDWVVKAP